MDKTEALTFIPSRNQRQDKTLANFIASTNCLHQNSSNSNSYNVATANASASTIIGKRLRLQPAQDGFFDFRIEITLQIGNQV